MMFSNLILLHMSQDSLPLNLKQCDVLASIVVQGPSYSTFKAGKLYLSINWNKCSKKLRSEPQSSISCSESCSGQRFEVNTFVVLTIINSDIINLKRSYSLIVENTSHRAKTKNIREKAQTTNLGRGYTAERTNYVKAGEVVYRSK